MLIWEKKTSSLVKLTILGGNKMFNKDGLIEIFFKGIKVGNDRGLSRHLCSIYWDILGMSTKETLSINRNEIQIQARKILNEVLSQLIVFALAKYKELILRHPEYIQQYNLNAFEIFMLNEIYSEIKDENIELKRILMEHSQYVNIKVLQKDIVTNKYKFKVITGSEILRIYPQMAYVDFRHIMMIDDEDNFREKIINELNSDEEINEEYIVIDEEFNYIIERLPIIKVQKVKTEIDKYLYIKWCDKHKFYSGVEANEYTIKHLLMYLGKENEKRTVIPALKKYDVLSVNKLRFELYHRYSEISLGIYRNNYIISPITDIDVAKIHSQVPKELFVSEIKNRKDFINLIDFVYENQVTKSKYSKNEITQEYFRLIGDYIAIIRETTCNMES